MVVLHLLFILFVLGGGLLALRWRWVIWLHLPAAAWGMATEFFGWYCPLTPLETWLREKGGGPGYETSFIEHYLLPIIYPSALTREIQLILGSVVLILNLVVYFLVFRRWARRRRGISEPTP